MSEFIVKTQKDWNSATEKLPEIGKAVEVLCVITTRASLLGTEPQAMWGQEQDAEAETEVKLWREIDDKSGNDP